MIAQRRRRKESKIDTAGDTIQRRHIVASLGSGVAHVESVSRDARAVMTQRTYPRRRESDGQWSVGLSRCSSCCRLLR
ncbi:MAG: hypothetical protein LZF60_260004 [Nitrospira sp.]|nr:MAG: hypothetical protein LZF60_260004 [Nitrospira sp.]